MSTNCGKKVTMVHDNITLAYFLTHFTEGYRSSSYGNFVWKGFILLQKQSWMFELRTFHEKHIVVLLDLKAATRPQIQGFLSSAKSNVYCWQETGSF